MRQDVKGKGQGSLAFALRPVGLRLSGIIIVSVIDLGDITTTRGTEMVLPLWLNLRDKLGTTLFNFKIVK